MVVNVVLRPGDLRAGELEGCAVVVLDVLRATTSMAAALAAGVASIRIYDTLAGARAAAGSDRGARLLCGEERCLRPEGFDLGNSPGDFSPQHRGHTVYMATTNGTVAIVAARGAAMTMVGALVNATATAGFLVSQGRPLMLLCAGTHGQVSLEDLIGAGAIIHALNQERTIELTGDSARMALRLFEQARPDLRRALADSQGGRNVAAAGLGADIEFASRLDAVPVVGRVWPDPPRVERVDARRF